MQFRELLLIFITIQHPRNQQPALGRHAVSGTHTLLTQRTVTKNETLKLLSTEVGLQLL